MLKTLIPDFILATDTNVDQLNLFVGILVGKLSQKL